MRRRGLVLGGVTLGLLAGCAGSDAGLRAEVDATVDAELRRRPGNYVNGGARAWRVSRDRRDAGLLWGTWHVGYDETTVMPRPVRDRFGQARSVSVEFVPDALTPAERVALRRTAQAALLRPDAGALGRLDLDTRTALRAAGVDEGEEARYSLLALANLVSARAMTEPSSSLPAVGFVDLNLIGFARSVSIPVRSLEAPDVLADPVYRAPNGPAAASLLRGALRRREDALGFRSILREWYRAGQIDRMLAGLTAWRADAADLAWADTARQSVLTRRNRAWMPGLEATLQEDGEHFVAFGAAHLTGEDGVVALLRAQGWDVTACVGDRCG